MRVVLPYPPFLKPDNHYVIAQFPHACMPLAALLTQVMAGTTPPLLSPTCSTRLCPYHPAHRLSVRESCSGAHPPINYKAWIAEETPLSAFTRILGYRMKSINSQWHLEFCLRTLCRIF